VKESRQAGKTELVTLLVHFLIIFYKLILKSPLMAAFTSPKAEQAKTDVDRIKKSILTLRGGWQVDDRESNSKTIRAYRFDELFAEIFTFSLSPTTQNEFKTLNLLVVEEAHNTDYTCRSNQLDPMLASTDGVAWMFGVGETKACDFKRGCDWDRPDSISLIMDFDRIVKDRRKKFEETGEPRHLNYEKKISEEIRKKGRQNPEVRRNYLMQDITELGNFVSRERFLSCGRPGRTKNCILIECDDLTLAIDWA
jgi:hypothetical protein